MYYEASYNTWCSAAARQTQSGKPDICHIEAFLDLMQDVPAFFCDPPKDVDLIGRSKSPLTLRSSLLIETTEDPTCERRWKTIDYIQCLGFPTPMTYNTKCEIPEPPSNSLPSAPDRSGYLTSITLAWSYIISCRWVKILQHAGQKSSLMHHGDQQITSCFWDLVIGSRWVAQVKRAKGISYAPWMLRKDHFKMEKQYVKFLWRSSRVELLRHK